jgi:hypothetical protein
MPFTGHSPELVAALVAPACGPHEQARWRGFRTDQPLREPSYLRDGFPGASVAAWPAMCCPGHRDRGRRGPVTGKPPDLYGVETRRLIEQVKRKSQAGAGRLMPKVTRAIALTPKRERSVQPRGYSQMRVIQPIVGSEMDQEVRFCKAQAGAAAGSVPRAARFERLSAFRNR